MGKVTRSFVDEGPVFNDGSLVFGPTASFNIPLLGTSIRGELRFYFGDGMIISGTYGISYSL